MSTGDLVSSSEKKEEEEMGRGIQVETVYGAPLSGSVTVTVSVERSDRHGRPDDMKISEIKDILDHLNLTLHSGSKNKKEKNDTLSSHLLESLHSSKSSYATRDTFLSKETFMSPISKRVRQSTCFSELATVLKTSMAREEMSLSAREQELDRSSRRQQIRDSSKRRSQRRAESVKDISIDLSDRKRAPLQLDSKSGSEHKPKIVSTRGKWLRKGDSLMNLDLSEGSSSPKATATRRRSTQKGDSSKRMVDTSDQSLSMRRGSSHRLETKGTSSEHKSRDQRRSSRRQPVHAEDERRGSSASTTRRSVQDSTTTSDDSKPRRRRSGRALSQSLHCEQDQSQSRSRTAGSGSGSRPRSLSSGPPKLVPMTKQDLKGKLTSDAQLHESISSSVVPVVEPDALPHKNGVLKGLLESARRSSNHKEDEATIATEISDLTDHTDCPFTVIREPVQRSYVRS
jgi:hypothetical protein